MKRAAFQWHIQCMCLTRVLQLWGWLFLSFDSYIRWCNAKYLYHTREYIIDLPYECKSKNTNSFKAIWRYYWPKYLNTFFLLKFQRSPWWVSQSLRIYIQYSRCKLISAYSFHAPDTILASLFLQNKIRIRVDWIATEVFV